MDSAALRPLLLLGAAAVCYALGGVAMQQSAGLTLWRPGALVFVAFIAGAGLQALGMAGGKMSVAYVIVLGLEAVLAVALGVVLLGERVNAPQLFGTVLVVAGIVVLKAGE
ncbi:MAG: EamA family transporter [Gemmatimonadaceae bacterium]|nr:EamA family transporter [Gemmatimonadaceae bacterium]